MSVRFALHGKDTVSAPKKEALLQSLRTLLRASFELRRQGALNEKQAKAQGYADGYLRALVDAGIASERELLVFVQDVRRGVEGPSTVAVSVDESVFAA